MTFLKSNLAISIFKIYIYFRLITSHLDPHTGKILPQGKKKNHKNILSTLFVKEEGWIHMPIIFTCLQVTLKI